jgi:hypothetical protein
LYVPSRASGPFLPLSTPFPFLLSFGSANALLKVLAIGFLLVILSCALFKEYLPLLVVVTYVLAPLPNWICGRCANPDDFVESGNNAVVDLGRFCTGFLVLMGIGMLLFPLSVVVGEGRFDVRGGLGWMDGRGMGVEMAEWRELC